MKTIKNLGYLVPLFILSISCCNQSYNDKASRDQERLKIGNQFWMSKNLNVSTFKNGDSIPQAKTEAEWKKAGDNRKPAWCYYNNDPYYDSIYGKLYNWYAVHDPRGLAPNGWRIPDDEDWNVLENTLGGHSAGKKLKSTTGWLRDGNGSNSSGFAGFPGGFRVKNGKFYFIGVVGLWWSSTQFSKNQASSRGLGYDDANVGRNNISKAGAISVRCIQD